MINPLTHATTAGADREVQGRAVRRGGGRLHASGHVGRGGWTWYTGSASWMYRIGLEAILGFRKVGDRLTIDPCVPADWKEYRIDYRYGGSTYAIVVTNPDGGEGGVVEVTVDGGAIEGDAITLVDDGDRHTVEVRRTAPRPARARAGS